ncbi:beta-glucuronidase [Schleiferilactobacillus harbinensis]|jgi:beta-glucuronidase|uniref:beta-glucuronidase n=1 Tax=Schleiferilactobacillus harbinensis TaxID=304207 RepID=UPI0026727641|nr:beta-glucuronidase [Schleiferilactobacillus harbinensis]MCI1686481.1 beta-glucuronidase [Schleiferilactobacillus harbinensis]
MLYPRATDSRAVVDLSGVWQFKLDDGHGFEDHWYAKPLTAPETMAVPGSYNDQKADAAHRDHYGWAFYQRTITVPPFFAGQRIVLRFASVTHTAKVYLDGTEIATHEGGFLPFEIDLTDQLTLGQSVLLTVAVDNRVNFSTLPVGNEDGGSMFGMGDGGIPSVKIAQEHAKKQNQPNFDFFNYAGIQRPVKLYTTPKAYIRDITLVPDIAGTDGLVKYTVATQGAGETTVEILDRTGQVVAHGAGTTGTLTVPNAHLWAPGHPYLYTAVVTFGADQYRQTFGIRTVRVEGTKFLINDQPFYFKGFGKHEDSPLHGRGFNAVFDVADLSLMHWIGANSFRTSHYPYAEEMYDLCDREGIVVIDETPAVGLGRGTQADAYKTMHNGELHRQNLRDMIDRDKNHPCVVMWSLANEPETAAFPQSAYDYFRPLYELAHELDPENRPVTLVNAQSDYNKDMITRTMDVVCINRYYGWYNLGGDLDAACEAWNIELDFWAKQHKPVMVTEYGADTVEGLHDVVPRMFDEEYQAEYFDRISAQFDKRPFFIGEQIWNFADFNTIQGLVRVDGNRKGVFTRTRRPKMVAHTIRRRWHTIPDFGYKA